MLAHTIRVESCPRVWLEHTKNTHTPNQSVSEWTWKTQLWTENEIISSLKWTRRNGLRWREKEKGKKNDSDDGTVWMTLNAFNCDIYCAISKVMQFLKCRHLSHITLQTLVHILSHTHTHKRDTQTYHSYIDMHIKMQCKSNEIRKRQNKPNAGKTAVQMKMKIGSVTRKWASVNLHLFIFPSIPL